MLGQKKKEEKGGWGGDGGKERERRRTNLFSRTISFLCPVLQRKKNCTAWTDAKRKKLAHDNYHNLAIANLRISKPTA